MQAQLANLTQTVNQTGDRLSRVKTHLQNHNDRVKNVKEEGRGQFLKSIKIDVQTFDRRDDPQLFLIGLNNLTTISCGTISLNLEKSSLLR